MASKIMCSNNENLLPPKFPALKSKGRALANAVNQDSNRTYGGKSALECQRENASKLASGLSVVDKADKENQVKKPVRIKPDVTKPVRNKPDVIKPVRNKSDVTKPVRNKPDVKTKHRFPSQIQAPVSVQIKADKLKCILEERQNKVVKPENVISLCTKQEVIKVEKDVKSKPVVITNVEEAEGEVVKQEEKPEVEKIPPGVNLLDKEEELANCEFLLGIYSDDIHKFLKHLEMSQPIRKGYLTPAHIMTQQMRSLLVDWLFEVQHLFKLLNETIHLAIALLDRFMQDHPGISKNKLQLVGVSCIFLASKYEEMFPPDLNDLVEVSAKTYTKMQIIKMEQLIFSALNYEMGRPSPAQFLRRYGRAGKVDVITYSLAKYFIDLSLVSYRLCHVLPSCIAASALYLSLYVLSNDSETEFWTPTLIYYSEYTADQLRPIVRKLASTVWSVPESKYQSVRNKYLDPIKMHRVSVLQELRSEKVYKLAQGIWLQP